MNSLNELVAMPWTIRGPAEQEDEHGNRWWEIRIVELPQFFVAAPTKDEVIAEYGEALTAFLESYTEHGEEPPALPDPPTPAWRISAPSLRLAERPPRRVAGSLAHTWSGVVSPPSLIHTA